MLTGDRNNSSPKRWRSALRVAALGGIPAVGLLAAYAASNGDGDTVAARAMVVPLTLTACLAVTTLYSLAVGTRARLGSADRARIIAAYVLRSSPLWLGVLVPLLTSIAVLPLLALVGTVLGTLIVGAELIARNSAVPPRRDDPHDEMLTRGYRLRPDLFVATWVVVIAAIVVDTTSKADQTRSLVAVAVSASLIALYWNTYAAFESDRLLSRGEQSKALFGVLLIAVPLLLSGRTDHAEALAASVVSAVLFVAFSERWRRIGRSRHRRSAATAAPSRTVG